MTSKHEWRKYIDLMRDLLENAAYHVLGQNVYPIFYYAPEHSDLVIEFQSVTNERNWGTIYELLPYITFSGDDYGVGSVSGLTLELGKPAEGKKKSTKCGDVSYRANFYKYSAEAFDHLVERNAFSFEDVSLMFDYDSTGKMYPFTGEIGNVSRFWIELSPRSSQVFQENQYYTLDEKKSNFMVFSLWFLRFYPNLGKHILHLIWKYFIAPPDRFAYHISVHAYRCVSLPDPSPVFKKRKIKK